MLLNSLVSSTMTVTSALFAQNGLDRPPLAGETVPANGAVDGAAATGSAPQAAGDMTFLYITFAILGGLILFTILSSRKERKRREALLAGIRKHDRVQTIGGIIGSVVEVKPETVILKVDEAANTRLTFARSAVQQVLKESSEPRTADDPS